MVLSAAEYAGKKTAMARAPGLKAHRIASGMGAQSGGACVPGRKQRKTSVKNNKHRSKSRNRTTIMFWI